MVFVSVIIPCFREEDIIIKSVQNVLKLKGNVEVIVSSQDAKTSAAARKIVDKRVRVIDGGKGRGQACMQGAKVAKGDVLLFKHADSQLGKEALVELEKTFQEDVLGGYFTLRFTAKGFWYRFLEGLTRSPASPYVFGDCTYWFEKKAYEKVGGFKSLPLFEDADFRRRWKKKHKFVRLKSLSKTSARRFKKNGVVKQILINNMLFFLYYAGVPEQRLANMYRNGFWKGIRK